MEAILKQKNKFLYFFFKIKTFVQTLQHHIITLLSNGPSRCHKVTSSFLYNNIIIPSQHPAVTLSQDYSHRHSIAHSEHLSDPPLLQHHGVTLSLHCGVKLSLHCNVTLSLHCDVTLSLHCVVTLSHNHAVTVLNHHNITPSRCHTHIIILSHYYKSHCHYSASYNHSGISPHCQSITPSHCHITVLNSHIITQSHFQVPVSA